MSPKSTSHAGLIRESAHCPEQLSNVMCSHNKGDSLCLIGIISLNVLVRHSPNFCPGNILSLNCLNYHIKQIQGCCAISCTEATKSHRSCCEHFSLFFKVEEFF